MLAFWTNPEFVRHRRSELRAGRALAVVGASITVCLVIALLCWTPEQPHYSRFAGDNTLFAAFSRRCFIALMFVQTGILTLWSVIACAQSISGERDKGTWDFQRVTRLTPGEFLIGKLIGEPILGYFILACCAPLTIAAGLMGHVQIQDIALCYLQVVATALFTGLVGIWLSSLAESRARSIGVIGALFVYGVIISMSGLSEGDFPGAAAISPLPSLLATLRISSAGLSKARLFGIAIPWVVMSLLLYFAVGAWFVSMVTRNIKRDFGDLRWLSRWQAVGFAIFFSLLLSALAYPWFPVPNSVARSADTYSLYTRYAARLFVQSIVWTNAAVLLVVGLATLTPPERLRIWRRDLSAGRASLFAENSLPWPWIVTSAIVCYGFLILDVFLWHTRLAGSFSSFAILALQSGVLCLFVARDILFIQWCKLTKMKAPVVKGFLWLGLYYALMTVTMVVIGGVSEGGSLAFSNLVTPFGLFNVDYSNSTSVAVGAAIQLFEVALLVWIILNRLDPVPRKLEVTAELRSVR
jgi:hypothetical protein